MSLATHTQVDCLKLICSCVVDLSGRIEEGSVFHSYHYYIAGITELGFAVLTGLTFKSKALLGCAKIFNMLGGVPITLQIDQMRASLTRVQAPAEEKRAKMLGDRDRERKLHDT